MNLDQLAQQHQNDHPGYYLTDWYEAALPTYELHLRVRLLTKQDLPAVEQFVMRLLDAGVKNSIEVGQILGIEFEIVSKALGALSHMGYIVITPGTANNGRQEIITITTKGRELLKDLSLTQPVEETLVVCLDAITGEYYQQRMLMVPQAVKDTGRYSLPTYLPRPTADGLDRTAVRRVWDEAKRAMSKDMRSSELLDIVAVDKAFVGYRSMRILQFVGQGTGGVLAHVYDGRDRSLRHEAQIMKMENSNEGLRALRAEHKPPQIADNLPDPIQDVISPQEYESVQRKATKLPRLESEVTEYVHKIKEAQERSQTSESEEEKQQAQKVVSDHQQKVANLEDQITELKSIAPTTDVLSMAEHRPRLMKALHDAKRQVIIISPWLSPVAVNWELRQVIEETVRRGVEVWIGHGFGEETFDERRTLDELEKIRKTKNGHLLKVVRLNDTHAKIVICDDKYLITTSFNWLSFAGRKDWGNRVEFGTLTRDKVAVQKMIEIVSPMLGMS